LKAVIDANIFPTLLKVCQNGDYAIRKELAWIVANAITGGTEDQMKVLIEQNVLQIISLLLDESDSRLLKQMTESIERILKVLKESDLDEQEIIKLLSQSEGSSFRFRNLFELKVFKQKFYSSVGQN